MVERVQIRVSWTGRCPCPAVENVQKWELVNDPRVSEVAVCQLVVVSLRLRMPVDESRVGQIVVQRVGDWVAAVLPVVFIALVSFRGPDEREQLLGDVRPRKVRLTAFRLGLVAVDIRWNDVVGNLCSVSAAAERDAQVFEAVT
ncbi:hypothetical protein [Haloplanus litoreus]|uniref:Uncharacterized protein n=1 Tax=Haloplanus litoreus TaxID=767515 RepID=A0ABD6A3H9_9EURY